MNNTYQQLTESFPQEMERTLNKGGANLTYIPVSEVINRLNKVLGVDKWSFSIVRCERDATDPDFVVAHVRIDWFPEEALIVSRDGFGGQKIKRNKQGQIVDLGDEFKGAISDALKKAAQTLGVGLYLARSEDAMEIEQVMDAPVASQEATNAFDGIVSISKKLNDEQKQQLNSKWLQIAGNLPKPRKATDAPVELLQALHTEAVRLSFNAESV